MIGDPIAFIAIAAARLLVQARAGDLSARTWKRSVGIPDIERDVGQDEGPCFIIDLRARLSVMGGELRKRALLAMGSGDERQSGGSEKACKARFQKHFHVLFRRRPSAGAVNA